MKALSEATRERMQRMHEVAVGGAIAAEAIAYELLAQPVAVATTRLISRVALEDDRTRARAAALQALRAGGPQLAGEFELAAVQARTHARRIARHRVALELAEVLAFANQIRDEDHPMPELPAAAEGDADQLAARLAGLRIAGSWTSYNYVALGTWWRKPNATVAALVRGLQDVVERIDGAVRVQAATQAMEGIAAERRWHWDRLSEGEP